MMSTKHVLSIMERLRKETKENHDQMEGLPFFDALVAGGLPIESYVGQLKAMAIVHSVLEHEMEGSEHKAVAAVREHRLPKLPLLDEDLEYFAPRNIPDFKTATQKALKLAQNIKLAHIQHPISILGYFYVFEGSTLGNAEHRADVAKTFDLQDLEGLSYYSSYKDRLHENWKQFGNVMNESVISPEDQDQIVSAARNAFDGLKEIYKELYPVTDKAMIRHVTSLNPEAGDHPIATDPRELEAAVRAGEKCWEEFPYYEWRYSSRGKRFTSSDSAWIAALVQLDQKKVQEQINWLGCVLSQRGMPQIMLERHLEILYEELTRAVPDREESYKKLLVAANALRNTRREFISDELLRELSTEFEEEVGAEGGPFAKRSGELIVAAVADERSGMEGAVKSIESWMTDASRLPIGWIQAVRSLIAKAREKATKTG